MPSAAIRPPSSRSTRSARAMVDTRWATTSVVAADRAAEAVEDRPLDGGVDGRGGVVEQEDPWVAQQRAGQGDPLALAARRG